MSQFFAPGGQSIGVSASASAFFMVHLSHPYTTTGKTLALTRWTFVSKVMSLLFNILSKFVIAFLPSSKLLLISQLQSPPAVVLEPKKIKSLTVSIVSPSRFSRQRVVLWLKFHDLEELCLFQSDLGTQTLLDPIIFHLGSH